MIEVIHEPEVVQDTEFLKGLPEGGTTKLKVLGREFLMMTHEWEIIKAQIARNRQAYVMESFRIKFNVPLDIAVKVINRVQIGIESGILR